MAERELNNRPSLPSKPRREPCAECGAEVALTQSGRFANDFDHQLYEALPETAAGIAAAVGLTAKREGEYSDDVSYARRSACHQVANRLRRMSIYGHCHRDCNGVWRVGPDGCEECGNAPDDHEPGCSYLPPQEFDLVRADRG